MFQKVILAGALAVAASTGAAAPANAAPGGPLSQPRSAAAVDRVCSSWDQVIPNVWAIICLDRSGALFQPYGEMRNYSSSPVSMDEYLFLNTNMVNACTTSPSTAAPGATLQCTNNTWWTASSPRWATGVFYVNSTASKTLVTPSFP
jgi:hypothetical protein